MAALRAARVVWVINLYNAVGNFSIIRFQNYHEDAQTRLLVFLRVLASSW
jgi:hypothetical protein